FKTSSYEIKSSILSFTRVRNSTDAILERSLDHSLCDMVISNIFPSLYEIAKTFQGFFICCISHGYRQHDHLVENNSGATRSILSYNWFHAAGVCLMFSCRPVTSD